LTFNFRIADFYALPGLSIFKELAQTFRRHCDLGNGLIPKRASRGMVLDSG